MQNVLAKIKDNSDMVIKFLPLLAFVVPMALLYLLNPSDPYLNLSGRESFEFMWKGRTFQLFFLWLVALEFILSWETIRAFKTDFQNKTRLIATGVALALPTAYIIASNYFELNGAVAGFSQQNGIEFYNSMPLATEYLVFTSLFCLIVFLGFGRKGLTRFALPVFFLGVVGFLYTIDNVFPYGEFTPFQLLVPTTASLATGVFNWMGYSTWLGTEIGSPNVPVLQVTGPVGTARFGIAWPCAGIESLLIFTAVALLFLKSMHISWKAKMGFFAVGAVITYFINVLRIVNIFMIAMDFGVDSHQVHLFHFYYGPLYSITWIISYPLIILASQYLWKKIRFKNVQVTKPQQLPPNPV